MRRALAAGGVSVTVATTARMFVGDLCILTIGLQKMIAAERDPDRGCVGIFSQDSGQEVSAVQAAPLLGRCPPYSLVDDDRVGTDGLKDVSFGELRPRISNEENFACSKKRWGNEAAANTPVRKLPYSIKL
jgi:hypothetical protein